MHRHDASRLRGVWIRTVAMLFGTLLIVGPAWTADPPSPPAKTGQTVSHHPKDDGEIQAGAVRPVPRFTDNRNGTVTDNATGLVWLKNPSQIGSMTWAQALAACARLGNGEAGLVDGSEPGQWRLPNRNELASLFDYGQAAPALTDGHPFESAAVENKGFWTSTTSPVSGGINAFYGSSGDGQILFTLKTLSFSVWPVRDSGAQGSIPVPRTGAGDISGYTEVSGEDGVRRTGIAWPSPRFSDGGNGTVRDNLTGLIWLKKGDAFSGKTWVEANALCQGLASGQQGLTDGSSPGDWRLPNINEMRSMFSAGLAGPAVPNTQGTGQWSEGNPFTGVRVGTYWTSTTDPGSRDADLGTFPTAYAISSFFGQTSVISKLETLTFTWPVRGGIVGPPPVSPPTVLRNPIQQVVYVGDSVVFQVEAMANGGVLSYRWMKGGVDLGVNSRTLQLSLVTAADAGQYLAIVTNAAGSATSSAAALIIRDAPPDNGRRFDLPKTGQRTTFASGDDGALELGLAWPAPRFTDNGDGTVTDALTGLVWMRNASAYPGRTWLEALDIASSLSDGVAGLSDGSIPGQWRLPTRSELLSLVDYGRNAAPMLPQGHPFQVSTSGNYWTSTMRPQTNWMPQDPGAFYININFGSATGNTTRARYDVWAVRDAMAPMAPVSAVPRTGARDLPNVDEDGRSDGFTRRGTPWPMPRFADVGDGTVRDNLTGLVWLKNADAFGRVSWSDGMNACAALSDGLHGLTDGSRPGDWRMPNVHELNSLLSMGWSTWSATGAALSDGPGIGPWTEGDPFINVRPADYMTSTAQRSAGTTYMGIDLGVGNIAGYGKSPSQNYLWPVRSAPIAINKGPVISSADASGFFANPGEPIQLYVSATDDGLPANPGRLTYTWSVMIGDPVAVGFGSENGTESGYLLSATASAAGTFVFKVTVSDGEFSATATTREIIVSGTDAPGLLSLSSPGTWIQYEGNQGSATIALTVSRTGGTSGQVSVPYRTQQGTADENADYIPQTGTISWGDGDSSVKTVIVQIISDAVFESNEQFSIILGDPDGGASLGSFTTGVVTIINDDPAPQPGVLRLSPVLIYSVEGDSGTRAASVTVLRQGGSTGPVSVNYSTVAVTAMEGVDYLATTGTLTWASGDLSPRTFGIPIVGDSIAEPDELFKVVIRDATGGAAIGSTTAAVTIQDDDAEPSAGHISIAQHRISAQEGDDGVTLVPVIIERMAGSNGPVSVRMVSGGGTATSVTDYESTNTVLAWADGEMGQKMLMFAIIGDDAFEVDETVDIYVQDPTGGIAIRDPKVEISIVNDDIDIINLVPGDLNGSGTVTFEDLSLFLSSYGRSVGDAGFLAGANLATAGSSTSIVDFEDLAAFLALYTP